MPKATKPLEGPVFKHDPSAFKVGDVVEITTKVDKAEAWSDAWAPGMDIYLGKIGLVTDNKGSGGLRVQLTANDNEFYMFPSTALTLRRRKISPMTIEEFMSGAYDGYKPGAGVETTVDVMSKRKKKRVRVGAGPWDAAPCTHLRWHLMGFFREKLALIKAKVKVGDTEVEVTQFEVACTKCGTKMTLKAK